MTQIKRSFFGATWLLDKIGEKLGLADDLRTCFPDDCRRLLSIAYFLILGDNRALMYFKYWSDNHVHPCGEEISSQDSSRLFASITEKGIRNFARLQGKRRLEKEYWAYDSTSISSYSEMLKEVKYGKNKESDHLPQINLLLLFGEKSGLPFYYRKLSGNIPDVKTVNTLVKELDILGYGKVKFVMDRGSTARRTSTNSTSTIISSLLPSALAFRLSENAWTKCARASGITAAMIQVTA